jgi:hypothetical protein
MKTLIILAAFLLALSSCTKTCPVPGSDPDDDGGVYVVVPDPGDDDPAPDPDDPAPDPNDPDPDEPDPYSPGPCGHLVPHGGGVAHAVTVR